MTSSPLKQQHHCDSQVAAATMLAPAPTSVEEPSFLDDVISFSPELRDAIWACLAIQLATSPDDEPRDPEAILEEALQMVMEAGEDNPQ